MLILVNIVVLDLTLFIANRMSWCDINHLFVIVCSLYFCTVAIINKYNINNFCVSALPTEISCTNISKLLKTLFEINYIFRHLENVIKSGGLVQIYCK